MMLFNTLLDPLTKLLNQALKLDPEAAGRMMPLEGKHVAIKILPFQMILMASFQGGRVVILKDPVCEADLTIAGTPSQLLNMAINKRDRVVPSASSPTIEGSIAVGQYILELLDTYHIDWEDHLAHFVGDTPAYHASRVARQLRDYFNRTGRHLSDNIHEYIHEEKAWFPNRERLDDFYAEVDQLREATDRMEARMARLRQMSPPPVGS